MHCENQFCVYYRNQKCLLNSVSLDVKGSCQSCIYVDLEEVVLERERERLRRRFEKQDGKAPYAERGMEGLG